jgi:hypothetical protein
MAVRTKLLLILRSKQIAAVACFMLASCSPKSKDNADPQPAGSPVTTSPFVFNGRLDTTQLTQSANESLRLTKLAAPTDDLLWALSICQCTPNFQGKILVDMAKASGALPQPIVPAIREQIHNDPKLKALMSLQDGALSNLLKRFFTNDDKIAQSIREGFAQKLRDALPGGTTLDKAVPFRFDLFPLAGNQETVAAGSSRRIHATSFGPRWSFVFSANRMFSGGKPIYGADHGLELFHVARTLAEWQYLYGLEKSATSGKVFGGLTIDPNNPASGELLAFDPRTNPQASPRIVSGPIEAQFKDTGSVDLALNVQEQWSRSPEPVSLDEQVKITHAAAIAFSRMRPENRQNTSTIFGPKGGKAMFPPETHQLPLIYLTGFGALLKKGFIDVPTRRIFALAQTNGQDGALAPMVVTARMARTLFAWQKETSALQGAELSADVQAQLSAANPELKKAAQLAVQTIIANHVRYGQVDDGAVAWHLKLDPQSANLPPMEDSAETISTLIDSERVNTPSPLLRQRIVDLSHWFALHYLDGSNTNVSATGVVWTHYFLTRLKEFDSTHQVPMAWLDAALQNTTSLISTTLEGGN